MTAKRCTGCGFTKDLSEFYKDSYMPDGYKHACKVCVKEKYGNKAVEDFDISALLRSWKR